MNEEIEIVDDTFDKEVASFFNADGTFDYGAFLEADTEGDAVVLKVENKEFDEYEKQLADDDEGNVLLSKMIVEEEDKDFSTTEICEYESQPE